MPSLGLITTGECEHRALGASLQRVFNRAELEIVYPFRRPTSSITSNYLGYPGPTTGPTHVDKLVQNVMATLARRDAPDLIFVVDDLELPNVATAHHVTQLVSDAFRRYLGSTPTHRELARLRERCSFHLPCPMLEAYFFGEPAALTRARAARPAMLDPGRHLEDFRVVENSFLFLTAADVRDHPWRRPDRTQHPKQYLSFLVDPDDGGIAPYKESVDERSESGGRGPTGSAGGEGARPF
jgi:PAS domain-containing protein